MNAIGEQISAILWNVFNRPRLIDLIDILLLTIIIYELLVHVRQTRVSQTIKGIIILLIATWLSDVLGMRTIHADVVRQQAVEIVQKLPVAGKIVPQGIKMGTEE